MSDMQRPVLSFAAGYHLRAKPLCDGRVKMQNFELKAVAFEEDGKGKEGLATLDALRGRVAGVVATVPHVQLVLLPELHLSAQPALLD